MLVAVALGLGTIDMPIPQIATWEWVNWKFPKSVRAGETVFARWTLTQKRPPVHGSRTGIVVWRVDVHTADGAMCAEGEVGAAVFRRSAAAPAERVDAAAAAPAGRRRRKRRTAPAPESSAPPAPATTPAPTVPAAERAPRRRRRRRPSGPSGATSQGEPAGPGPAPAESTAPAAPAVLPASGAAPQSGSAANPISRVMRRLRRS